MQETSQTGDSSWFKYCLLHEYHFREEHFKAVNAPLMDPSVVPQNRMYQICSVVNSASVCFVSVRLYANNFLGMPILTA